MQVEHEPLLQAMRALYRVPRGPGRFGAYLEALRGGQDEPRFPPLVALNPMAKGHLLERVEALIALGADEVAARAANEARQRLSGVGASVRTGLAVADDVAGGWTNRWMIEGPQLGGQRSPSGHRTGEPGRWVTVLLWASDEPDPERVRRATLAAVYRWAHAERFGAPQTLGQFLIQEGRARRFARDDESELDADDLDYSAEVIGPLLETTHQPTAFAAFWGDEIARSAGYPALGLSPLAGRVLALHWARAEAASPEHHLNAPVNVS